MVAHSKMFVKSVKGGEQNKMVQKEHSPEPKIDLLLQKLRHQTVELIEQGDSLTYQMHKLYKGVQHFVSENMYEEESYESCSESEIKTSPVMQDRREQYSPERISCSSHNIQKRLKMMQKPLCGYRFTPLQSKLSMDNKNQTVFQKYNNMSRINNNPVYPYFDPVSNRDEVLCTVVPEDSPVTVSSGYSSDKDTSSSHKDTSSDIHHSDCEDSLLVPDLTEGNISFCDHEVAYIHDQHLSQNNYNDDEFLIKADQLYESNSNNLTIIEQSSFKPIVPENMNETNCTNTNLNSRSDSFSMVRKSMKEIVRDLKDHQYDYINNKKVTRHHSLHEKHSQEYLGLVAQSKNTDITPPPITSLPGFHPAWCSTLKTQELRSPHFEVSQNSAFRPYKHSNTTRPVHRSKSASINNLQGISQNDFFSNSSRCCCEDNSSCLCNSKRHQYKEPVYATIKGMFRDTSTAINTASFDSGRGSSDSMVGKLPVDSTTVFSDVNPVYEDIDGESIYEQTHHIKNKRVFNKRDCPPELPARNPTSKYCQSLPKCSFQGKRPTRRHTLKLEDIVKPSDIVHTSGKHMYTVADILDSVDKLNQEIPAHCENVYSQQPSTKVHHLRRSRSHLSVNRPVYGTDSSKQPSQTPKFKKMFSPLKPTCNDCNTAQTKRLYKVDENPTEISFSGSPNSPGLYVIPTQYGLQFKSKLDDDSKQISKSMSQLTLTGACNSNKPGINWLTRNTGKEIFC